MWPNPKETADLVRFTEETLNGKRHFLCHEKFVFGGELTLKVRKLTFNFYKTILLLLKSGGLC